VIVKEKKKKKKTLRGRCPQSKRKLGVSTDVGLKQEHGIAPRGTNADDRNLTMKLEKREG